MTEPTREPKCSICGHNRFYHNYHLRHGEPHHPFTPIEWGSPTRDEHWADSAFAHGLGCASVILALFCGMALLSWAGRMSCGS